MIHFDFAGTGSNRDVAYKLSVLRGTCLQNRQQVGWSESQSAYNSSLTGWW